MKKPKKPQLAVRAIISNSTGEILMLKRANTSYGNGSWNLPGGKIEFGQTAKEALVHEIFEETNLICSSPNFLCYADNLPNDKSDLHFVTLFFNCKCKGNISLNSESSDYRWIGFDEIDNYDVVFDNDFAIKKYFKNNF